MKRNYVFFLKSLAKKAFLITSVIFICNVYALGQQSSHHVSFKDGSISYQGAIDEELIFKLEIENTSGKKIFVSLVNQAGDKIFYRSFNEKKISKNFKIPADIGTVTFIVGDSSAKPAQQFKISTGQRYIDEVSVKKVL